MKRIIISLLLLSSKAGYSQKSFFNSGIIYYHPKDLTDSTIITKEVVLSGYVMNTSKYYDSHVFLDINTSYPNNPVTIVAWNSSYKGKLSKLSDLNGKYVFISGKVKLFTDDKGVKRLGITLFSDEQIVIATPFKSK